MQDIISGFTSDTSAFTAALNAQAQLADFTNIGSALLNCKDKLTGSASTSTRKAFILISGSGNSVGFEDYEIVDLATDLKMSAGIYTVCASDDCYSLLYDMATDSEKFFQPLSISNMGVKM